MCCSVSQCVAVCCSVLQLFDVGVEKEGCTCVCSPACDAVSCCELL